MSIKERIEEQLGSHDVLLYMKGTPDFPQCGFSGQAVAALNAIGRPYAYVNIFEDPEIREGLKEYSNWPTFPQLYVKGEFIGGNDILTINKIVEDGAKVKEGDTVIIFDQSEVLKSKLDREAELEIARAELDKLIASQESRINELEANLKITEL